MSIEAQIKRKGAEIGFDRVGITDTSPLEPMYAAYHERWLAEGCAAGLGYLYRNNDKRFAPAKLLEGAQSIICAALNYRPKKTELSPNADSAVCRYAMYDDYHAFIKTGLLSLAAFIQSLYPDRQLHFKACCDAIPLAERALAKRAGLGFIGRSHLLIHPELGGQILLGELLTTLPLQPDVPLSGDFCADCRRCIAVCPTAALGDDGTFDARKCLSYLTIEEKGGIDETFPEHVGGRLFGCDACLTACPYEKNAPARANPDMIFHAERLKITPEDVLNWTQADFDAIFKGSCLERLGLTRLQRNARRCLK